MKKLIIFIALLFGAGFIFSQNNHCHWYLPTMTKTEADGLKRYDGLIIHNEMFYTKSPMIDYLKKNNPKVKLFVYVNPIEIFAPPFEDSPWSQKLFSELKKGEKNNWFILQPNGEPAIFWVSAEGRKTNMLNISTNCPRVNGQKFYEYMAERVCTDILFDKRISGILLDNTWEKIYWLGRYGQNKGLDFNRDQQADQDSFNIEMAWRNGEYEFIRLIRENTDPNFIIIANPGVLSFNKFTDGKQYEDWPFAHAGDTTNGGWNISMFNASKTGPYSIINAKPETWFYGLCSALLLENVWFSVGQNTPFKKEFEIDLGKPLDPAQKGEEFKKNLPIYSRRYEKGTVFVSPKEKKSWITNNKGDTINNQDRITRK